MVVVGGKVVVVADGVLVVDNRRNASGALINDEVLIGEVVEDDTSVKGVVPVVVCVLGG